MYGKRVKKSIILVFTKEAWNTGFKKVTDFL